MNRFIHISILLFLQISIYAQYVTIQTSIRDAETKQAIEYAGVYLEGTSIGAFTDINGNVSMRIPSKYVSEKTYILIQHTAYTTYKILLDTQALQLQEAIYIKAKENTLCTAVINELRASSVIQRSIAALDSTWARKNVLLHYYYKQTHKEDGRYVRLIEAFLDMKALPFNPSRQRILSNSYTITSMARSANFEQNDYVHGEHLNDLLVENYFEYPIGSPLYMRNSRYYTYKFSDTCDAINYYVLFDTKSTSNTVKTRGLVTIDKKSFQIKRIDVEKYSGNKSENASWRMRNCHLVMETTMQNNIMYLSYIKLNYAHDVMNQRSLMYTWVVEEQFELFLEQIDTSNNSIDEKNDNAASLYTKHYDASAFVVEKNRYKHADYENAIRKDLEQTKRIEEQWVDQQ